MNWIDELVKLHSEVEAPQSFYKWAGIAAISAILKDNVWIDRQIFLQYPNIYVMFHADSGMKKGAPVGMAKSIVKAVGNTRVISGRSSIQGILKELGDVQSHMEPGGKLVVAKSTAFICSSELTSSIVEDRAATTILTDLYDRSYNPDAWRSLLKSETFDLKDPTITMLTATNEAHSTDFFMNKDIMGGFFARTFIIHENEENTTNSLQVPLKVKIDYKQQAEYLKVLAKLKGPFRPTASREQSEEFRNKIKNERTDEYEYYTDAGGVYELWYRQFKKDIKLARDPTGTLNRFGESVWKVAMILALAEKPELVITERAMTSAIRTCEKLIENIRKVTFGRDSAEGNNPMRKRIIILELVNRENHKISRKQLLSTYWIQGNRDEWDECIVSLLETGAIKVDKIGNELVYWMDDETVEEYRAFLEGRKK